MGAYSINYSIFDVGLMLLFGVLGYLAKKYDYPPAPLVLALVLGPMMENALRQSLIMSQGSIGIFFARPISTVLMAIAIAAVMAPFLGWARPRALALMLARAKGCLPLPGARERRE